VSVKMNLAMNTNSGEARRGDDKLTRFQYKATIAQCYTHTSHLTTRRGAAQPALGRYYEGDGQELAQNVQYKPAHTITTHSVKITRVGIHGTKRSGRHHMPDWSLCDTSLARHWSSIQNAL